MTVQDVSVKKLTGVFCVYSDDICEFDTWGTYVAIEDVKDCINALNLQPVPFSGCMESVISAEYDHAARIAYLVLNPDNNPIEIDVGIPSIGYYDMNLVDGNHRLAAAIYRKDKTIMVNWTGEEGYFKHLFMKKSKKYAEI